MQKERDGEEEGGDREEEKRLGIQDRRKREKRIYVFNI